MSGSGSFPFHIVHTHTNAHQQWAIIRLASYARAQCQCTRYDGQNTLFVVWILAALSLPLPPSLSIFFFIFQFVHTEAICVSYILTNFVARFFFWPVCFIHFIIPSTSPVISCYPHCVHASSSCHLFHRTFSSTFPLNVICSVSSSCPLSLIAIYTTIKFIVDFLPLCCAPLFLYAVQCMYHSAMAIA